jgi:hypothetical protein
MVDAPTIQVVIVDGRPLFEVSGQGITSRHQQLHQAQLRWHCLAVAAGYDGPAPVLGPQ